MTSKALVTHRCFPRVSPGAFFLQISTCTGAHQGTFPRGVWLAPDGYTRARLWCWLWLDKQQRGIFDLPENPEAPGAPDIL